MSGDNLDGGDKLDKRALCSLSVKNDQLENTNLEVSRTTENSLVSVDECIIRTIENEKDEENDDVINDGDLKSKFIRSLTDNADIDICKTFPRTLYDFDNYSYSYGNA